MGGGRAGAPGGEGGAPGPSPAPGRRGERGGRLGLLRGPGPEPRRQREASLGPDARGAGAKSREQSPGPWSQRPAPGGSARGAGGPR